VRAKSSRASNSPVIGPSRDKPLKPRAALDHPSTSFGDPRSLR
jgi:hypothetical protein